MEKIERIGYMERRRKRAGLLAMVVGLPNLVLSLVFSFGGIGVTIILGIVIISLFGSDSGDDPLGALCVVMILILVVVLLIMAILFTIVSVMLAICIGGQTIGGWYAYKGINFRRSVVLILIGSIASLIFGISMLVLSLGTDLIRDAGRLTALGLGIFETISFALTVIVVLMLQSTKTSFSKTDNRGLPIRIKKTRK